jgi:aspartate aminotransferase-like enzyme
VETDAWGLDFVFTGSQKALALPPGIALGAASER